MSRSDIALIMVAIFLLLVAFGLARLGDIIAGAAGLDLPNGSFGGF